MKLVRTPGPGFGQRLVFDEAEFDAIALQELRAAKHLPAAPGPVCIDRFIEHRFGLTIDYQDLGPDALGAILFTSDGAVRAIMVSDRLAVDSAERLFRSTLAHEAGHGLLHGSLFIHDEGQRGLKFENADLSQRRILCRTADVQSGPRSGYDGRWWEYQANRMIGSLLLRQPLVTQALASKLARTAVTGSPVLPEHCRQQAQLEVADLFAVNLIVAGYRLEELFPKNFGQQEF